jgi:hypothetical protein
MALFDKNLLSDSQAITASAASTNVLDLGAMGTPPGAAGALVLDAGLSEIQFQISVTEDFATLTSLVVSVQTDDADTFGSPTTILATQAIPVATLKKGYTFNITELPQGITERYLRLLYTVAGSNATAGKIIAGVVASARKAGA